jgi:hypothetical protein
VNKVKVRCWKVHQYRADEGARDELLVTYPEDNSGHSLITCLTCGAVFAVTVAKEVYCGPPLEQKLSGTLCPECERPLGGNWASYPDTYVANGKVFSYDRPNAMPPDSESIVVELDGIYE